MKINFNDTKKCLWSKVMKQIRGIILNQPPLLICK
jgi:hypothetical protein